MDIDKLNKTDLETLSYADIAFLILKKHSKQNTLELFKKVCDKLGIDSEKNTDKIGDFYTTLSTDCRFLILDDAKWDIRDNHVVKVTIDDEEEVIEEAEEETEDLDDETEESEDEEEIVDDLDDDLEDEIEDDELKELSIIDEEDLDK